MDGSHSNCFHKSDEVVDNVPVFIKDSGLIELERNFVQDPRNFLDGSLAGSGTRANLCIKSTRCTDVSALGRLGAFAEDSQARGVRNCDVANLAIPYIDNVLKRFHFAESPPVFPRTIAQKYWLTDHLIPSLGFQ